MASLERQLEIQDERLNSLHRHGIRAYPGQFRGQIAMNASDAVKLIKLLDRYAQRETTYRPAKLANRKPAGV